jgi:hypothetical protein
VRDEPDAAGISFEALPMVRCGTRHVRLSFLEGPPGSVG